MYFYVVLFVLSAVLPSFTAPSTKRDAGSQLKDQMENFQSHMSALTDQFKTVLETVKEEKGLGKTDLLEKRGTSSEAAEKKKEKEMLEKLKDISIQLGSLHKQINSLREKVHSMKESLDNQDDDDDDDDDDDFDLDRREIKESCAEVKYEKCIKESIVQEKDPFILRIALTIMKRINAKESRMYIEKLVNVTADHQVAKANATHGIKEFHNRLLKTVLQLLKVRSILTIKTEGKFIDKLEDPKPRTLEVEDKDVDRSKVVQSLGELLEGPLAKGFVSKKEEKLMIESAIQALGGVFQLTKNRTASMIRAMIENAEHDVKTTTKNQEKGKALSDDDKIKGLQKMVEDKTIENKLNLNEMKLLVKGLVAAVGARNKLSAKKTKEIEDKILKGIEDFFAKSKIPVTKMSGASYNLKNVDTSQDIPAGFEKAESSSNAADKSTKKTIMEDLKELGKLTSKYGMHSLPSSKKELGDSGDEVIIDAATNTRGSTRIVEHHNGKREHIETEKGNTSETSTKEEDSSKNLESLLDDLQSVVALIKNKVASYRKKPELPGLTKNYESVNIDAATGTMGHRKIDEGFKRKRGLADIVADAIAMIKSLQSKQQHTKPEETTTALPTTVAAVTTEKVVVVKEKAATTETTTTEVASTEAVSESPTTSPVEEAKRESKKSEISVATKKEIDKAEDEIQSEIEQQQRGEESKMLLAEEMKKEKEKKKKATKEKTEPEKREEVGQKAKKSEISDAMEAEVKKAEGEIQKELEEQQKAEETKTVVSEEKENEKLREEKQKQKEKEEETKQKQKEKEEQEKERKEQEEEKRKQKEEEEKEKQKQKEEQEKEKKKEQDEKQKKGSNEKKIEGSINEARIEADEKEIQKELGAQSKNKDNLFDKLESLQNDQKKQQTKESDNKHSSQLMKELDELFAKN